MEPLSLESLPSIQDFVSSLFFLLSSLFCLPFSSTSSSAVCIRFPSMSAYSIALHSQVDCIEIDVSRSSDGVLFALHDSLLSYWLYSLVSVWRLDFYITQAGICSGYLVTALLKLGTLDQTRTWSHKDLGCCLKLLLVWELDLGWLKELDVYHQLDNSKIPTIEDALKLISASVRQVILDAKVGPPSYEKGLANDILSTVEKMQCKNCLIWAKSDSLVRDIIKLSSDVAVGYVVMVDPHTGAQTNLLRMKGPKVAGVYHQLIDERMVKILHGREKKVYAWTVDDVDSMMRMLHMRADAIVTSNPTLLQRTMQDKRTQCLEEGFSLTR
ncbi:glycerophosphodiester phosphodiesterase GDPD4 [Gossypium australe]|uniref:glycerophosphodiester phosphodiesterase n=1 Tax=Gossypium australe TaxID=47621 RepID=A0A5B6UJ32_9ROSI|nr:glycerophosphodiester phosphodiesterase GDPD4 [Gossypium australe]